MIFINDHSNKYITGDRSSTMISLQVHECTKRFYDNKATVNNRFFDCHSLIFIVSGEINISDISVSKNNMIYINKFSTINYTAESNSEIIQIFFYTDIEMPFSSKEIEICAVDSEIINYVEKIYSAEYLKSSLTGLRESLLWVLIDKINKSLLSDKSEEKLFRCCYLWIERNARTYITASDVAKAMNCTVAHLNRVVKKHSAKCLSTIIAERKVFEIKQLCADNSMTIQEIAVSLGFETSELLRKFFKYHTGMSISEYRRLKF